MAETTLRTADVLAVKSRVSWGAIFAGAMVALAVYFVLTVLGVALGLELVVARGTELGAGPAIYSILVLLLSMFLGGWATSRLAVGESRLEAVLYGVILWGVLMAALFWLIGVGVRVGFNALISGAVVAAEERNPEGVRPVPLDQQIQEASRDPEFRRTARQAAWYTLAGVSISMLTVILGSLIGSGDLPVPVPVLGVRRAPRDPRA